MTVEYKWAFGPFEILLTGSNLEKVIVTVFYKISGIDGKISEAINSKVYLDNPDPGNFIPFKNITETQIKDWVFAKLGTAKIENLTQSIDQMIFAKKYPKTAIVPAPWEKSN